jgi:hypothetical protein
MIMKLFSTAMLIAAVATMALGQTARSEAGALASIISRASSEQANALVKGLTALEKKGTGTSNSSWPGAWDLLLATSQGSDRAALAAFRESANSFDVESVAILVRDAYFGGIDDDGTSGRTLGRFSPAAIDSTKGAPVGRVLVPEEVILVNLKSKMPAGAAATFERVVRGQEKAGRTEGYKNYGYINAEKILVAALNGDGSDAFVSAWKSLSYDDREVCLQLIRDAFLGGLHDL